MNAPNETALVRQLLHWLALQPRVYAWRVNQGALTVPAAAGRPRRFVRFSTAAGCSDILGVVAPAGRLLAVECKVAPKTPTDLQLAFLGRVRALGGITVVAYSLADLEQALRAEGVLP